MRNLKGNPVDFPDDKKKQIKQKQKQKPCKKILINT